VMSSKANVRICWRTPSSKSSKSFAVRFLTTAPVRSRTTTSTSTRLTPLLKTGVCGGVAGCCPPSATLITSPHTMKAASRRRISVSEPRRQGDGAHRAGGLYPAEGWRVDIGVDGRPLDGVEQVDRVDLQCKSAIASKTEVTLEQAIELSLAGA